jgi:riboflavin synthase
MYTGVVETTGVLRSVDSRDGGCRLRVAADTTDLAPDDSISVHGVCLTAERVGDDWFEAFCSRETVARTYLADCSPGDAVNVERPVAPDGALDGHVVKGTVDTVTTVVGIEPDGDGWRYEFRIPAGHERYLVEKGAIAIDGISLTVADVTPETFTVAVVPTTREVTTLSEKSVGDPVHFEADLLAKYVERQRAGAEETA